MFIWLLTSKVSVPNIQNVYYYTIRNAWLNLFLLIHILLNIVIENITIHLQVDLDRCVGNSNILNDLSNRVCVPNKTEDLNLSIFNIITGINKSKILTKHENVNASLMLQNVTWIKSGILISADVSAKI